MSMTYRRDVPRTDVDAQREEADHIRAHLSACANYFDNPRMYASEVSIQLLDHPEGDTTLVSVVGFLDRDPHAPYTEPDYDPETESGYSYEYTRWIPEVL